MDYSACLPSYIRLLHRLFERLQEVPGEGFAVDVELISRAAAIEAVYYKPSHKMAIEVLKEVPAVDAVPVVHAKWDLTISMYYGDRWQADASCSCCNFMKDNVWSGFFPDLAPSTARSITRHYAEKVKLPAYCERCGARMDGERRNDNGTDT